MASPTSPQPIWVAEKPESTAVRVERQIKEAVLDGRLSPGDFLGSENDLAAKFGVSRLPIREALGRLRALGVVEIRTGAAGGVRIATGDPAPSVEALAVQFQLVGVSPEEVFDAQFAIETAAVRLAAQVAVVADLDKIEAAIEHARQFINQPDGFTRASLAVHQAVVDASHNHVLSATMQAIVYVLFRSMNPSTTPVVAKRVIERHRNILAAIRERDVERAQSALAEHLKNVRAKYFTDGAKGATPRKPGAGASRTSLLELI